MRREFETQGKEYKHDIYLLSDEPYRELIYSDKKYPFITNYYDNSIVAYSFSKSLSLPGERIGYVLVGYNCKKKADVFAAIVGAGRALGYVCASSLFQYVVPKCLGHTADLNAYKENRDILHNALKEIGYETTYPEGAFYLFVKVPEKWGNDDMAFVNHLKTFNILCAPGCSFGGKGYFRISYCVSEQTILNSKNAFKEANK